MSFQSLRYIFGAVKSIASNAPTFVRCSRLLNLQTSALSLRCVACSPFHTSVKRFGLEEFFDDKKNWKETKIYVGRPWRLDELRIKSNEDLHKLWYVLLKERNMLMTMQSEYLRIYEPFPNPERIDKVEESMENILTVVDERNETYNVLEKGVTGKPGGAYVRNALGMMYYRKFKEHLIPKHLNEKYNLTHSKYEKWMSKYLTLYYEKKRKQSFAKKKASERLRRRIKAKYPHLTTKEINTAVREEMKKPY